MPSRTIFWTSSSETVASHLALKRFGAGPRVPSVPPWQPEHCCSNRSWLARPAPPCPRPPPRGAAVCVCCARRLPHTKSAALARTIEGTLFIIILPPNPGGPSRSISFRGDPEALFPDPAGWNGLEFLIDTLLREVQCV